MFRSTGRVLFLATALVFAIAPVCGAQTNTENFTQFEFNFNNPGARAAAIGGAFISIADDATAAESNPAGLTTLLRPEISFELKGIRYDREIVFSTLGGSNQMRTFQNSVVSPSFASVVYPFEDKSITASLFRHELVNFESGFFAMSRSVGAFNVFPVTAEIEMEVVNWGGAVAYKVNDKISVGVAGGISTINTEAVLKRFGLEVFDDASLFNTATIDDDATDAFVNVGIIVRPTPEWSFGATFKRRPKFELQHAFRVETATPVDSVKTINVNVPSAFGVGASYRPNETLTLAFDAVYIRYSELTDNFAITIAENRVSPSDYDVDDTTELHFGAEYVTFLQSKAVVLRGGGIYEPQSSIQWAGAVPASTDPNIVQNFLFQEGEDDFHFTYGLGIVLSNNVQLDIAGNLSDGSDEVIGSIVLRR